MVVRRARVERKTVRSYSRLGEREAFTIWPVWFCIQVLLSQDLVNWWQRKSCFAPGSSPLLRRHLQVRWRSGGGGWNPQRAAIVAAASWGDAVPTYADSVRGHHEVSIYLVWGKTESEKGRAEERERMGEGLKATRRKGKRREWTKAGERCEGDQRGVEGGGGTWDQLTSSSNLTHFLITIFCVFYA